MFFKIKDYFLNKKTISGQFIAKNKIWTIYIKRGDKKKVFYVSNCLKKYKLSFENLDAIKKNKELSNALEMYFEIERCGKTNWEWLIYDYYGTGHLNEKIIMYEKPNFLQL